MQYSKIISEYSSVHVRMKVRTYIMKTKQFDDTRTIPYILYVSRAYTGYDRLLSLWNSLPFLTRGG